MPVESRKAQLEAMQSSKQSDFERDAKVLSNPTTLARAAAPSANAGAAFASVAEYEKACSSGDFERKWLRGTPAQRFRAASGFGARPSSDFERKARPVRCFRVLPAWLTLLSPTDSSGGFTI